MPLANLLQGGDRRSVGNAKEVVALVIERPSRIDELMICAVSPFPVVRSRATHALMQLVKKDSDLIQPHLDFLLEEVMTIEQWEVRAHFAQTVTCLKLATKDVDRLLNGLQSYLLDSSSIVRTCAMQALVDICDQAPDLVDQVRPIIVDRTHSGTAAMRARGRKLLKALDRKFPQRAAPDQRSNNQ